MAITLVLTTVTLSSISVPSLDAAIVSYILGFSDSDGTIHDVMVDNGVTTVTIPLTPGSPIPTPADLIGVILADVQSRYAALPDDVIVNGTAYPVSPPSS